MNDLDFRWPDLKDQPRSGTVRWFDEERGYGRITADDGEVLFVHRSLHEGQRVTFRWTGGIQDHGRHSADDVRAEQ